MAGEPTRERTSELLAGIAAADGEDSVPLGEIVDRFGVRAFGILMVLGTLAAFIPTPVGAGAIAGPMVVLVGAQLLVGMKKPWLPRWLRQRKVSRAAIGRFVERMRRPLQWLERVSRPRWVELFAGPWPVLTGLLVIGHAIVLALPIPLTNYPLAMVLMLVGVALVEDDGIALAVSWLLMAATIVGFLLLSETLVGIFERWFA